MTGDVPAFEKKEEDRIDREGCDLSDCGKMLPDKKRKEFLMLLEELEASGDHGKRRLCMLWIRWKL